MNGGPSSVAVLDPGHDFTGELGLGGKTTIQTLAAEHGNLQFDHVQPTGTRRRVMPLEAVGQVEGLLGQEVGRERARLMGVEVVLNQDGRAAG